MPRPASSIAHLVGGRVDEHADEAVRCVDRAVGLVLARERDAALAQGALERIQGGVGLFGVLDTQAQDELALDRRAVEGEAGRVVAAVAHGLAHVDQVATDRAAAGKLDAADAAHSADLLGRVVVPVPGQTPQRVLSRAADVIPEIRVALHDATEAQIVRS